MEVYNISKTFYKTILSFISANLVYFVCVCREVERESVTITVQMHK